MGENDQGERGGGSSRRRRLEGVIPDLIKRAVEIGVEKAAEAPDTVKHIMSELKLPKGMAGYVLAQIDETKNGVVRVVANEVRDFLEHTNLAGEAQKILTSLQFEVNTTIRFRPNSGRDNGRDKRESRGDRDERSDSDAPSEDDDSSGEDSSPINLPKPEVKTDIYVKREDRRERRTRSKE